MSAPANVVDHKVLPATLDGVADLAAQVGADLGQTTMLLDAGYDNRATRELLAQRGLGACISPKGDKTPINHTERWKVERTNSWMNDFGLLRRMTERREQVVEAMVGLAEMVVTVRCLIVGCWDRYRWENRPRSKRIRAA